MLSVCQNFNELNNAILNNSISKNSSVLLFKFQLQLINQTYFQTVGFDTDLNNFYFPLQGYNAKAIGGKNGNGYFSTSFNYFDGDKHTGHAAHDIFINDKNQDELNDNSKKPVNILAFSGGVVVAIAKNWEPSSYLRGGKFIYIYNPKLNILCYYVSSFTTLLKVLETL